MAENDQSTSFEFQSEVRQLLHILAYSLYKNKEVFLRELISNAADALNKVQFELLSAPEAVEPDLELKISIELDKKRNVLVIEDTGIGMTREDLVNNIGTIARSGTLSYLQKLSESKEGADIDLIGQFGVGFYSSFMVASEIHLYTRYFKPDSPAYLWKSSGENSYTIEACEKQTRGTRIELVLKKDEKEFLESFRIKTIIDTHSKFVPFPIYVEGEKTERVEAIWTQPKSNLKETDYVDFYKFFEGTGEEPETWLHLSSDAPVQFTALLYAPKTSFELPGFSRNEPGVDLYSRKILIQKESKDLFPEYLRFVKGVVDSEEIPLNISRETVQNNVKIEKIRRHVIKKWLDHLESLKKKKPDSFRNIWKNFGRMLKEGVIQDFESRERLAHLLLFRTSRTEGEELIDLKGVLERMQADQKEIYFAAGPDLEAIRAKPALEVFRKREIEVLFLLDPLEEFVVDHLREYEKKPFKSVESADIQLEKEEDKEGKKGDEAEVSSFITYLKTIYGDRIQDVKTSRRLVDNPCMLAHPAEVPSAQMEKIMKMMNKEYKFAKRILEINPEHPLIAAMTGRHQKDPADPLLKNLALQLLDNQMLREGVLDDVENSVARIQEIMLDSAGKG